MEIASFLGSQGNLSSLREVSLAESSHVGWFINESTFLRVHVTAICRIQGVTRA